MCASSSSVMVEDSSVMISTSVPRMMVVLLVIGTGVNSSSCGSDYYCFMKNKN